MSSTAAVARPAEPQRPAQASSTASGHGPAKAHGDKPAATDLFANLLSLVNDTHLAGIDTSAQDGLPTDATGDAATNALATPQDNGNPLAALLALAAPALGGALASAATAASGHPHGKPREDSAAATAAVTETPAKTPGGVAIDGMTRTDEPAPAGLLPSANAARPAFSHASPGARQSGLVSRAGESATSGTPAMVWQRAGAASRTDALQQQHAAQAAQAAASNATPVRSTVALDERFNLNAAQGAASLAGMARQEDAATAADALAPAGGGTPHGGSAAARHGLDAGLAGPGALADTGASGTGGERAGDSPGDALPGDPANGTGHRADGEQDTTTVTHWGTQHLRHASLRVGEGSADAIDVQLSLKGQEVQVAFQSDNADARAHLREHAGDALADLMQRSGIQLGNVSVGGQSAQQQDGLPRHTPTVQRGDTLDRADTPAPSTPQRPRTDGSRPLDVFA
ncbi:flagellar hook-length control protein FliK [Hydrogenophaga sp.]|uniref:flagellar hook-length control protein FliK n=1 Tax=Hydrogenophaga sp. TaxID=1904254 RepID=UPI0026049064|nr:flagellar hook-length control protein FliK [Hydrogenophaga sp.]MCW5654303.1 flagellar hook-length control protein FliK [Hydrogenophaga sp.]